MPARAPDVVFVARAPRNDSGILLHDLTHTFAFPRREAPEWCMNLPPERGRGECRMHAAPAVSCAK
jgi:hypothetical protein